MLAKINLKQGAYKLYSVDYTNWLQSTETLTGVIATVSPATVPPLEVIASVVLPDSKKLSFVVGGGLAGTDYEVTLTTSTTIPAANGNAEINQVDPQCIGVSVEEVCPA